MILQHFCKNFTEGCKVQVDDLKHDVPDEVVDIDMSKIRKFFSDDAYQKYAMYWGNKHKFTN